MVVLKCPRCRADVEIEDHKVDEDDVRVGVFCKNEKCRYHKSPLIGIERKSSKVYISESIV